jgi:transcriptional regulator with XRE-family HTH domain
VQRPVNRSRRAGFRVDAVRHALHDPHGLSSGIGEATIETIGERLRRLRLERGLSQRELSGPGVSYAYISRIEAGARKPSVKALRTLAGKLGVSTEYLETGADISARELRELHLTEAELRLRLDDDISVEDLEEILRESEALGDDLAASRARIALGTLALRRGDDPGAITHLERALASEFVDATSRPDVFATLGHAYAETGQPWKAVELYQRGLVEAKRAGPGNYSAQIRLAIYLGYTLADLGELEAARNVAREIDHGEEMADPYARVRLYRSLAQIAHERMKPLVALDHFRRAIAVLEATEDTLHLARAHMSMAAALIAADDADWAQRQVESAELLLGGTPEPRDLVVVRRLQASIALARGDAATAAARAREALELADGGPSDRGLALAALAAALALQRDEGAEPAYREATQLLMEHGTLRDRNAVLRAFARYLRELGRDREAADVLERATETGANSASGDR